MVRPRIFSHDSNVQNQVVRKTPLITASESDLNSQANNHNHNHNNSIKETKVKRLINNSRQKWALGLMRPRSFSTPENAVPGFTRLARSSSSPPVQEPAPAPVTIPIPVADRAPAPPFHSRIDNKPTTFSVIKPDPPFSPDNNRCIVVRGVPASTGLNSMLAQTSGGPLEKVVSRYENTIPHGRQYLVELHFMKANDARVFYKYAINGLYRVNGRVYMPSKGPPSPVNHEILNQMMNSDARRCLCLTKWSKLPTKLDPKIHRCHMSAYNPTIDLSLNTIKRHFAKLGLIISIQPMVSQCITVCIQYADVKSAIRAKTLFDRREDDFARGYSGWDLYYGQDVVDRPCPPTFRNEC